MVYEFEGETEEDAIAKAVESLGLSQGEFDVEILEATRKGIFKKGNVKIRIQIDNPKTVLRPQAEEDTRPVYVADPELEGQVQDFVEELLEKMGFRGTCELVDREAHKIIFEIRSPDANILIGKHGKNLDAIQLLANVYLAKVLGEGQHNVKVVLDMENYRGRREDSLVRMAMKAAQAVRKSRQSRLLEPMNPFERRLVHTALSSESDLSTESEGDGLIKQIRISYVGD